ncbi:MAG: 3-dehydroquinate synthase II, partial [Syntrophobacteraceae bacterium]
RRPWEIIPLENLVARGGRLIVPASSASDLELALGVLEKGVAGVVIDCPDAAQIRKMLSLVKAVPEREALSEAIIEAVRPVGIGDRVCVDTCTLMEEGEGLLVGNSSGFLVLVQAEAKVNPYVAPRPFRVNAGPVHAYTRVPGGGTRYLSELRAGDPVLVVRARGEAQPATVGRVKIERRPLLLIEARCGDIRGSIILQNAETIRLTAPDGEARSVVDLRPGDPVLAAIEPAGRHFGMKVDETIREH